jgi:nucleotide-binding universal stress UspA family protein
VSSRSARGTDPPGAPTPETAKAECCFDFRRLKAAARLLAMWVRIAESGGGMKFTNILYPVDFSERCRTVAPFVNAIAKHDGASLTLVNFVEIPPLWYGTAEAPCAPDLSIGLLIEGAEQRLAVFAKDFFPGSQTKTLVREGDPGSCIVEMARASDVDLIMMPTRGRGRFRTALLGSVTAKVLHDSKCAVWTAAHADAQASSEVRNTGEVPGIGALNTAWRNVVCGIDTTPDAVRLIRYAGQIASSYGAAVHLVHAVPPPPGTQMEQYLNRDFEAFLKDSARKAIGAMQKEAGTDFRLCIEAGSVSSIVAAAAQQDEADLVLIGRGELPHFGGRLRTHVYGIIRDAPCPVLSI